MANLDKIPGKQKVGGECKPSETLYIPSYEQLKKKGRKHIHNTDNVNKKKKYKKIYVQVLEKDKNIAKKKAKKKKLEHDDVKQLAKIFRKRQLKAWKKSVKKILDNPDEHECDDSISDSSGMNKKNFAALVHRSQRRIDNANGVKVSNVQHSSKLRSKSWLMNHKSEEELIKMAKPLANKMWKNALSPVTICDEDEDDPDEDIDADAGDMDEDAGEEIAEVTEEVAETAGEEVGEAAGEEGGEIAADIIAEILIDLLLL